MRKGICQIGHKKLLVRLKIPWTYVLNDLNGELQATNQQEFRVEKVIKRKTDKLYVKLKGYNNYFNSLIDKKDII